MDNYLAASSLIIARLHDKVPQIVKSRVRAAQSEKWVIKNPLDDSISVIFHDDQPVEADGGQIDWGKNQISEQFWLVVISSKNVTDSGNAARKELGVIALNVLQALQGWLPSAEHSELYRRRCPFRVTDDEKGFVHISFLFSTRIVIDGLDNDF